MKTSVIGYPRIGVLRELRRSCVKRIGKIKKNMALILFLRMISHFMIIYWTQQFYWISYRSVIENWDWESSIHILLWRADTRGIMVM